MIREKRARKTMVEQEGFFFVLVSFQKYPANSSSSIMYIDPEGFLEDECTGRDQSGAGAGGGGVVVGYF